VRYRTDGQLDQGQVRNAVESCRRARRASHCRGGTPATWSTAFGKITVDIVKACQIIRHCNDSFVLGVPMRGTYGEVVAPIDDGTDAPSIGERLLLSATSLLERCTDVRTCDLAWLGPAVPGHHRLFSKDERQAFLGHVGTHRSAVVLAASYCARGCAAGFALWREDGLIWICWTPQGRAFEAWLRQAIPEFPLRATSH